MGFPQIGYQAFKLVAHQRLHELAKHWEERYPGVDIVLIEPEANDELMFQTSMMNFASRVEIARHGFESVTQHLAGQYDRYHEIAERHEIEISPKRVTRWSTTSTNRKRSAPGARSSRGRPERCCARPGPPADALAGSRAPRRAQGPRRGPCRSRRAGDLRRSRCAGRCARDGARPAQLRRRPAHRHGPGGWTARRPPRWSAAAHRKLAWLSVTSKSRSRSAAVTLTRSEATSRTCWSSRSEQLRSASRAPAWETSETPRSGSSFGQQILRARARRACSRRAGRPAPTPSRSCGTQAGGDGSPAASARRWWVGHRRTRRATHPAGPATPSGSPSSSRSRAPAAISSPVGSLGLASAITRVLGSAAASSRHRLRP